jgi:hydrogenase nickel incorporation protein HypA/HybF
MGVVASIIEASEEAVRAEGGTTIREIRVSFGDLTEVVDDALQFAFEALKPGTMAENGVLIVEHIPARSRCRECGEEFTHDKYDLTCPKCDSFLVENLTGREQTIDTIEFD